MTGFTFIIKILSESSSKISPKTPPTVMAIKSPNTLPKMDPKSAPANAPANIIPSIPIFITT